MNARLSGVSVKWVSAESAILGFIVKSKQNNR